MRREREGSGRGHRRGRQAAGFKSPASRTRSPTPPRRGAGGGTGGAEGTGHGLRERPGGVAGFAGGGCGDGGRGDGPPRGRARRGDSGVAVSAPPLAASPRRHRPRPAWTTRAQPLNPWFPWRRPQVQTPREAPAPRARDLSGPRWPRRFPRGPRPLGPPSWSDLLWTEPAGSGFGGAGSSRDQRRVHSRERARGLRPVWVIPLYGGDPSIRGKCSQPVGACLLTS